MWTATLEWVKAIGFGSIIGSMTGVFVGARLTRQPQDRQFERQAVPQRVDRARAIYMEASILGLRLTRVLTALRGRTPELPGQDAVTEAEALHRQMFEATVKLSSEGASVVAH